MFSNSKTFIYIVIIVLVLLGIGVGFFSFYRMGKSVAQSECSQNNAIIALDTQIKKDNITINLKTKSVSERRETLKKYIIQ